MRFQNRELYGSSAVAKEVSISLRQLYHWVDILHAVEPKMLKYGKRQYRRFSMQDLHVLRKIHELVERGYTLRAAIKIVQKDNAPNAEEILQEG